MSGAAYDCVRCGAETAGIEWVLCESCRDLHPPHDPFEFSESDEGEEARHNWARRYDELLGAPEGDWDR